MSAQQTDIKLTIPQSLIEQIVIETIEKVMDKMQPQQILSHVEFLMQTRKEVNITDITSMLKSEGKIKTNGTYTVESRIKLLVSQGKLKSINAIGHSNKFKMQDIYNLFKQGEFDEM